MKHTHCTLRYFKEDGKYYSDGELDIPYERPDSPQNEGLKPVPFWQCVRRVRDMLDSGKRPGLVDGYGFNTLLTVYSEFGPMQWFFVRGADRSTPQHFNPPGRPSSEGI